FGGVSSSQDVVFMFSIMYERASSAPMMLEVCITQANQEQADGPAGRRLSRCRPSGRHSFSLSHTHTHTHTHSHTHTHTHTDAAADFLFHLPDSPLPLSRPSSFLSPRLTRSRSVSFCLSLLFSSLSTQCQLFVS